eukprot:TCONS_00054785-protein
MQLYYFIAPAVFSITFLVIWFRIYAKQQANRNRISNMDRTTEDIAIGGYPQQPTTQQGNGGYPQQQIAQPGGGGFGFGHPPPQPNGTNTNPMFPNNNHFHQPGGFQQQPSNNNPMFAPPPPPPPYNQARSMF